MLNHQACEDIIASVKSFVTETKSAIAAYEHLPAVIDEETSAIKARDVAAMEMIVRKKLQVGQNLEQVVSAMMENALNVLDIMERHGREHQKFELNVTAANSLFKEAHRAMLSIDSLKADILAHLIDESEKVCDQFLLTVQQTSSKIEVNKLVTAELLTAYQESIRFWENVATEYEATYTDKGVRKTDPNHGVIKVGA